MTAEDALRFLSDRYYHSVESDGEDNAERFRVIEAGLAARTADPGGLREAARAVVNAAEPDEDGDGQFIEYLVPDAVIAALRAALTPEATAPDAHDVRGHFPYDGYEHPADHTHPEATAPEPHKHQWERGGHLSDVADDTDRMRCRLCGVYRDATPEATAPEPDR